MFRTDNYRIRCGDDTAALDYCICASSVRPVVISFYGRDLETLRAVGAGLNARYASVSIYDAVHGRRTSLSLYGEQYHVYIAPVDKGKDPFYHAVAISKELGKKYFISTDKDTVSDYYSFLMENYDFPLLKEWSGEIFAETLGDGLVCDETAVFSRTEDRCMTFRGESIPLSEIRAFHVTMSDAQLQGKLSYLLKKGKIRITEKPQTPLSFKDMDDYFNKYGTRIVQNLEKQLSPLAPYEGNVDDFTLKHKRLFPQQAAMVHGVKSLLLGVGNKKERRKNHSRYAILNEGMGTGKTIQGAAICEAVGVAELLHGGATLKDVYGASDNVHYRNIVMCPGHLVEKWAAEIREEVPYSKVKILREFSDVLDIWKKGPERNGREFFVMSKDFAKLSYQEMPVPTHVRKRRFMRRMCLSCGKEVIGKKCSCGDNHWKLEASTYEVEGMQCPCCGNVLLPYGKKSIYREDIDGVKTLMPKDFAVHNEDNSFCLYCGEKLWQPHVHNLGTVFGVKQNPWLRVSHYANKACKGKKSVWVHRDYQDSYFREVGMQPLNYISGEGTRRIDPAGFIKKHMKNFFDVAIFDEVHTLKGGDTAQGHAMHALVKASKRQLALTGTIAGGYAHHLFYMLYRLDPQRMRNEGFTWTNVSKFSEIYGCMETLYEAEKNYRGEYNVQSRGRKLSEPKCQPGISPLIFTKFLLDKTVMLDISDMSSHLPKLKENVVLVEANDPEEMEAQRSYKDVVNYLKDLSMAGYGMTVLSTMLQFSLSYLDKPYGVLPIMDPLNGQVLVEPENYEEFSDVNRLLAKEEKLIELVKQELSEGRNCFVFAEYTNSPQTCVTGRLKAVLEHHVPGLSGKVEVLESATVSTQEREEWIHKKAEAGMKVCIVNPKCVETGLDFCFTYNGKTYNYPSIIFYQLGYSLFTIWQASRRHYRLNQKEECRTYYMAYKGTVQEVVISLIAEKMAATSAIQGKFSAEGLSAMAQGVDSRLKLAQALSDMDTATGKGLQEMFDVINDNIDTSDESGYVPMKLLSEIIGEESPLERTVEELQQVVSVVDDFFAFLAGYDEEDEVEIVVAEASDDSDEEEFPVPVAVVTTRTKTKRSSRNRVLEGQITIF